MNESSLIKAAKAGDKNAFAELYIKYKDSLYRYAYFKLGNEQDALDTVSSCIVEAYTGIASVKNEKAFSSWLFKILYRRCCAAIKQATLNRNMLDIDEMEIASDNINILSVELKEALAALSEEEKDIVLLSAVAGYSSKEIGQITKLKPATVRSKLSRALAKMREFLR